MRGRLLYLAFVLSGAAGLTYEVVWTRYLALWVGHGAYAQVLVLTVYLGGMAVGAIAVGDASRRLHRPLLAYAGAEAVLAVLGALFHPAFVGVVGWSYASLFPALAGASAAGAVRWGIAALLLLPSSIVLGATFPLMAAGLARRDPGRPGRAVSGAYLANTLGGAAGVLIAGFVFVPRFGLPGALVGAAALNAAAAALAWLSVRATEVFPPVGEAVDPGAGAPGASPDAPRPSPGLVRTLLAVSFGTAVASFTYEIGWTRLLALVLGSATHSFELMLSAFVLGLGLGAALIQPTLDRAPGPIRRLGVIQVAMGLMALATFPFHAWLFDMMGSLVTTLPGRDGGYVLFNLSRYALALGLMLPATVLAGTTLPLITTVLLRARAGERAIGRVYGCNTLGSIMGAIGAGLFALPLLGLKGLLVAAAALDMALGVWLLASRQEGAGQAHRWRLPVGVGLAAAAACLVVAVGVRPDQAVLTSGVFRYGRVPQPSERRMLYYHDGRTASVGVHLIMDDELVVLSTNGKPDASLESRWLGPPPDPHVVTPIDAGRDVLTQVLAPLVALAHAPGAERVANVGHGSGMTGQTLLAGPSLRDLVTIEIEPSVVEASFSFLRANHGVFEDPRSHFVFDDARAYFAYTPEPFDLVFAEPSNPWVSGTATLFTEEFYREVRAHLAPGGILAQWMQLYEIDDDLVLSVLAAVDAVFGDYRAYLVGDADVLIVATRDGPLPEPDWRVAALPGIRGTLQGAPPFLRQHLDPLFLIDRATLRPALAGVRPNSDFHPVLDIGAERTRFRQTSAAGFLSLGASRVDLRRIRAGERTTPGGSWAEVPARGLGPAVRRGRTAWLHGVVAQGGGIAPENYPSWQESLVRLRDWRVRASAGLTPDDWATWVADFEAVEADLHMGTAGWVDSTFYDETYRWMDVADAPPEAGAAVDLVHGMGAWDWPRAAAAADVLVERAAQGLPGLSPGLVLDASALAYLYTGRPERARAVVEALSGKSGRRDTDLRDRLLRAWADADLRASDPPGTS